MVSAAAYSLFIDYPRAKIVDSPILITLSAFNAVYSILAYLCGARSARRTVPVELSRIFDVLCKVLEFYSLCLLKINIEL